MSTEMNTSTDAPYFVKRNESGNFEVWRRGDKIEAWQATFAREPMANEFCASLIDCYRTVEKRLEKKSIEVMVTVPFEPTDF